MVPVHVEIVIHKKESVSPFIGFEHFEGSGNVMSSLSEIVMQLKILSHSCQRQKGEKYSRSLSHYFSNQLVT